MAKPAARRRSLSAEEHLRRLLGGAHSTARYRWPQVLAIARALTTRRSARNEALLRRVALFSGTYRMDPTRGMPHAMPPEDVMRCIAVEALGRWNARKHRDVIRQVVERAERQIVADIAKAALRN